MLGACSSADPDAGFTSAELAAELRDKGVDATTRPSPYVRLEEMAGAESVALLCLDGQEAQAYEYGSTAAREADQARIRPTGNLEDTVIDLLWGRLGWWARGRVIVSYHWNDPAIRRALTDVAGEPLSRDGNSFGPPPDPLPESRFCPG